METTKTDVKSRHKKQARREEMQRKEGAPASVSEDAKSSTRGHFINALILARGTIACLAPFAGKAFHIDDTLFLYAARQIQVDPSDPYGFTINWYETEDPMTEVTKDPRWFLWRAS